MAGHELKAMHTKSAATNKDLLIEYIYKLECSFIFIIYIFCSTVICKLIHYIFALRLSVEYSQFNISLI